MGNTKIIIWIIGAFALGFIVYWLYKKYQSTRVGSSTDTASSTTSTTSTSINTSTISIPVDDNVVLRNFARGGVAPINN